MYPYISALGLELPSYGVMCAAGIVCALIMCLYRARRIKLRIDIALVLFTGALAFGMLGALLSYVLITYGVSGMISMIRRGAFADEFTVGYVFYGGFAAGLLGAWALAKLLRARLNDYARAMLPALPLAHAFGRVGCYMAGCCYGIQTCEFLGAHYPESNALTSAPMGVPVLPVQLIEAALLVCVCVFLVYRTRNSASRPLRDYALAYAPMRFLLEFLRGDAVRGALWGLSTSQWASILILLAALLPVKSTRKG